MGSRNGVLRVGHAAVPRPRIGDDVAHLDGVIRGELFHGSGSPLCQDAAGSGVLGLLVAGPGSGLSEELVWGCEPAALESESLPCCPPGPVAMCRAASLTIVR